MSRIRDQVRGRVFNQLTIHFSKCIFNSIEDQIFKQIDHKLLMRLQIQVNSGVQNQVNHQVEQKIRNQVDEIISMKMRREDAKRRKY